MSRVFASSERVIAARPDDVYATLVDYRTQHPRILTANFLDYRVEEGGLGNGTLISFRLQAAGRERPYRMRITEPVPGQVITEQDSNSSLVTTWTLTPLDNGQRTNVRINTEWEGSTGVGGFFEHTFAPLGLQRIYAQVLERLNKLASSHGQSSGSELAESYATDPRTGALLLLGGLAVAFAIATRLYRQKVRNQG